MSISPRFTIRYEATPALLDLLTKTTLGTNGARYRHLETRERILEADNPLFLSLERDGKVQGNITFCRRNTHWYVRYFAFSGQKQAARNGHHAGRGNSFLKNEIAKFYQEVFDGEYGPAPDCLYAYIDPQNERSKWMAEQFDFRTEAQLVTQTFSRVKPCSSGNVRLITDPRIIAEQLALVARSHAYFVPNHTSDSIYYGMFNDKDEIIAFTRITRASWVIERLPGNLGGLWTKIIPFIPRLRKIIRPDNHRFLVPEAVRVIDNDPGLLSSFFEGILAAEAHNVILWWVDKRELLWHKSRFRINWGMLDKLTHQTPVDVVVLRKDWFQLDELNSRPIFVAGWDMV